MKFVVWCCCCRSDEVGGRWLGTFHYVTPFNLHVVILLLRAILYGYGLCCCQRCSCCDFGNICTFTNFDGAIYIDRDSENVTLINNRIINFTKGISYADSSHTIQYHENFSVDIRDNLFYSYNSSLSTLTGIYGLSKNFNLINNLRQPQPCNKRLGLWRSPIFFC